MYMIKKLSLVVVLFISILTACKEDEPSVYTCLTCVDTPEANATYDNTGQGIYKGVLVGSTGTVRFDIANDGTSISAVLMIDGAAVTLTANGTYSNGFTGSFTGSLNGGIVIIPFSVSNTGVASIGTPTISGHTGVVIKVIKEKSTQLVEAYEGEFGGNDSGTFNLVLIRNQTGAGEWIAISRSDNTGDHLYTGEVQANALTGASSDIDIVGEISGDKIKGTWEYTSSTAKGNWIGKRTL